MAVAVTLAKIQTFPPPGGTAAFTTTSFAVTAGDLLVAFFGTLDENTNSIGSALTVSDSGGNTWTALANTGTTAGGYKQQGRCWRAIAAATNGALTVSFDCGANALKDANAAIFKCTGHDTTTPIGGKVATASATADGALTITLDAAPSVDDVILAFVGLDGATSGTIAVTPGSGWTEDGEVGTTASQTYAQVQHITGVTSTSVAWVDIRAGTMATFSSVGMAAVVKAAAAAASEPPTIIVPTAAVTRASRW